MEMQNSLEYLNVQRTKNSLDKLIFEAQDFINLSLPLFTLRKKCTLAYQEKPFQGLYIVKCGTLKQIIQYDETNELLSHFFLPGDLIGLDAIGEERYCGTITTIETSGLYHIPFKTLDELPISHTSHMQLLRCFSRIIYLDLSHMRQIISQPAVVRLACFFITMSCKFSARGYSPYYFRLAMSRKEIADYLCMAIETLSRLVSRFQQQGILSAHGHEYCLLNSKKLVAIAERKI